MGKLEEAIELCKNKDSLQNFNKGLKIFDELIGNTLFNADTRVKALTTLIDIDADLGNDKIIQSRDKLPHFQKDEKFAELEKEVEFLSEIIKNPKVSSHERLMCATCLYNHGFFEYYHDLFAHLAKDISVLIDYRIEAIRYLLYSEISKHIKSAKKCLISIIKTKEYPSLYRYRTIASFNSKTGLSTILNKAKLNVEYDEELLYTLQKEFFWDTENGIRERILSGQSLLTMESIKSSEKEKVGCELLEIAKNYDDINVDNEEKDNTKADAADVVLRLGTSEQIEIAREVIKKLGFIKGKRIQKLTEKSSNVYNDKQNVHDSLINQSVNEFISELAKSEERVDSYDNCHKEVLELIYKSKLTQSLRDKAFKSLNRISIDEATFTDYRITTAEIFVHVWSKIKKSEFIEELKKRLVEELIDMADTCSSGHASRLINILSGYGFEIKVSWSDQIKSNLFARLQKRINNISDPDLQENVVLGMIETAEPKERDAYLKFLVDNVPLVREELYKEFVGDKYISDSEFNKHFEDASKEFI